MKNLFIVNTPFHLLTAFIISQNLGDQAENYLALVNPHSYDQWPSSPVLSYLSSPQAGYKKVFPLPGFLSSRHKIISFKEQVQQVKNSMGQINFDTIYLGSDIYPQNQFLVAILGHKNFYRYEDGLYSYYNENRRRSWCKEKFHKLQMHFLMQKSGIPRGLELNTSTASDSKAGLGDFMYKPHLLQRYSPAPMAIESQHIHQALAKLKKTVTYKQHLHQDSILYLSQPLVEKKLLPLEDELKFLRIFQEKFTGSQLVYKAHPNDSKEKLAVFQKHFPNLQFWPTKLPAEIILVMEKNLRGVISYESSTLMYTDIFAEQKLLSLSLSDCTNHPMYDKYKEIMVQAGVVFPKNLQELANCWQQFLQA